MACRCVPAFLFLLKSLASCSSRSRLSLALAWKSRHSLVTDSVMCGSHATYDFSMPSTVAMADIASSWHSVWSCWVPPMFSKHLAAEIVRMGKKPAADDLGSECFFVSHP